MSRRVLSAFAVMALASAAWADFVPVSLSPNINADIRTYSNGLNYPIGGQTLDVAGVPFALELNSSEPESLGVTQITVFGSPEVYNYEVSVQGALRLFTLINSAFGNLGANNGSVEVFGLGGAYAKIDLIQGVNIRDHFNSSFVNTLSDPTVVPTLFPGDVRLDRQVLELPAAFLADTVINVRFSGTGDQGAAFLAGATFEVIPTPAAAALLVPGLVLAARRRR